MHSFIIQIFTFKTLIVFQKLGTIRMLVKNSTGLSNLEEKREYSPTDHVRYCDVLGGAQPVIPPNLYSMFMNIITLGPQVTGK